ncbi:MAG: hypothetical protein AAF985_00230 [Bacteroidota bacterium]
MNKIFLSLLLSLLLYTGWAQDKTNLDHYFAQLAQGKKVELSRQALANFRQNAQVILQLDDYLYVESLAIKREALRLSLKIGAKHKHALSRQQMVNQLLKKAANAETAILGPLLRGLRQFHREDFNQKAKNQLGQMIRTERPHLSKLIKLAGFLQMKNTLQTVQIKFKKNTQLRQSVGIALTRCGDDQKRKNLMKNITKYRVNDEFVHGVLPQLVYTRQKETTDYLFGIILRDQKTCSSPANHGHDNANGHHHDRGHSDHDHGKINCAYRIMEAIAPYVKGIPLQVGSSGDLVSTDYQQTLKTTREWIRKHQHDYQLNTDIY